jgi:hypothetical protein
MDLQFILRLGSFDHWQGGLWLRSLKNLTSTVFCPIKSLPQIQESTTTKDLMTISRPLFIILLIYWELVKWICSLFFGLGHLAIGREDCGSEV